MVQALFGASAFQPKFNFDPNTLSSNQGRGNATSSGGSIGDRLSLSQEASNLVKQLGEGQQVLNGQRTEFLSQQLKELNGQIGYLRGLLGNANADQAQTLRSGIEDVGRQLDNIGLTLQAGIETRQTSVSIEAVRGSLSQSFAGVAEGSGGRLYYAQQLEGEFSFFRLSVSEQITSLNIEESEDGSISVSLEQTQIEQEIIVSSAQFSSQESVSFEKPDPLQALINQFDDTSSGFDALVDEALEALSVNDGGVNELLAFLDDLVENGKVDLFA